jgi:hypothetical protein
VSADEAAAVYLEFLRQLGGAGNIFNVHLIRPGDVPPDWITEQIEEWLGAVWGGQRKAECLGCGFGFSVGGPDPGAFSVCAPAIDKPAVALLSGICSRCAGLSDGDLFTELYRALEESEIFSNLRRLDPVNMHGGGQA